MVDALFFMGGFVMGIVFITTINSVRDNQAVRLGMWVCNGVAYQLNRFEGGKTDERL